MHLRSFFTYTYTEEKMIYWRYWGVANSTKEVWWSKWVSQWTNHTPTFRSRNCCVCWQQICLCRKNLSSSKGKWVFVVHCTVDGGWDSHANHDLKPVCGGGGGGFFKRHIYVDVCHSFLHCFENVIFQNAYVITMSWKWREEGYTVTWKVM